MLNQFNGMGNLTRDVELRYIPSGKAIATVGLAINRKFGNSEETLFLDVDCWDKLGELVNSYCQKGSKIFVSGRLKQDTWDDKETGQKRSKIKLVAETVQFLDRLDKSDKSDKNTSEVDALDNSDTPF